MFRFYSFRNLPEREKKARREVELLRKEKNSFFSDHRYEELVENTSDLIFRINYKGKFLYANNTALTVCGYTWEELRVKHYSELITPAYRQKISNFYFTQFSSKTPTTCLEFPIITKTGEQIWVGLTVDIRQISLNRIEFIALARNITDQKYVQQALAKSEEKYRGIMENLELGLLEVDNSDRITNVFPKFCEMTGYTREELLGKKAIETLLPPEFRYLMLSQNEKRKLGYPGVYEVQLLRKDGKRLWVIISGAPYYDRQGKIIGSFGIHLDITERKKMEDELRIAKEVAENSMKSKEQFMANMSHEIRTPMNAIIGMCELLLKSNIDEKEREFATAIQTSASNLLIIINDILDFSKIESGRMELEKIPVYLPSLLSNAIKIVELKAEEKGLTIDLNIDNGIKAYLTDPTRLSQIFINLLSNAIKFTHNGYVSLQCKIIRNGEINDEILFKVKDTGIGIKPEHLEKIFESFIQADESTSRKYGGTGLGLSISKQLVEMMNGKLEVSSEKDKGSEFYFTLSLQKCAWEESSNKESELQQSQLLAGKKVLLVEDHEINRFMAQTILCNWYCEVDTAENGIEAVKKAEKNTYDIILMDMRMPEMDGIEATGIIRNKLGITTPVIALTANALKSDSEKCIASGMNDYVSKPFRQDELMKKMLALVQDFNKVNPKEQKAVAPEEKFCDLTHLRRNVGDDKTMIHQLIRLFLNDTPAQLLLMETRLLENDFESVSNIAHKLKPSVDCMAGKILQQEVRVIENGIDNPVLFTEKCRNFFLNINRLTKELENEIQYK